jgi:hypothetical protein
MANTTTSEFDNLLPSTNGIHNNQGETDTLLRKPSPLFYGLGTLGLSIGVETFGAFAYFYYIDTLGLAFSLAALVRTIYAVWDAVNDPLFSYLSDSTRTRWSLAIGERTALRTQLRNDLFWT